MGPRRAGRGGVPARAHTGGVRTLPRRREVREDRGLPLTPRELNRATLARQLLLERAALDTVDAVSALAGLQAQESVGPYIGLWSRLRDFRRDELTEAIRSRRIVLATLHRVTMHLVTAEDHAWLKPTLAPMLAQTRRRPVIRDLDQDALLDEVRRRLPARMRDLRDLATGVNPGHFNDLVQASLPLVRVPPAGTWRRSGSPLQELVDVGDPDVDRLVLTYLRAFGPATVRDAQAWSGLARLAPIFARLDLDELGDGYFDAPGAPRPPAEVEAPVRFLPRWDNLYLAYADRSRFGEPVIGTATYLVDGRVAGTWAWRDGDVELTPFTGTVPQAVERERRELVRFLT